MIITHEAFLTLPEVEELRGLTERLDARDGRESAAGDLREVKRNREIRLGEHGERVRGLVLEACNRAPMLGYALLPRTVTTPILSVYEPGMAYGTHTDSAVGSDGARTYRSDLSCTIFLDDPSSYDGGELHVETTYGEAEYRLAPGGAVFYPTLFLHRVNPVTRGRRRACVFWIESLVREPEKRAILFDLAQLGAWVATREPIESQARQKLVQVRENLYRMWIET